jgi:hypothetical protein
VLIKYTYPIVGDVFMPEHWPFDIGSYRVEWTVSAGKAKAITVSFRTSNLSGLPTITPSTEAGIKANIHFGLDPHREDVENFLRTASGLIRLFASAAIEFEHPTIEWVPENQEERAQVQMSSWTSGEGDRPEALPVPFDIVSRCFIAAKELSDQEVPLSFLSKGKDEMAGGRYIEAFYNLFFFLETQFAAGYSNPKHVLERFRSVEAMGLAIADTRAGLASDAKRSSRLARLLEMDDDKILEHLVETRGRLHHHAPKGPASTWHPTRQQELEAEAKLLLHLASSLAMARNVPQLYNEATTSILEQIATKEGVAYQFSIHTVGGADRYGRNGLPDMAITLPVLRPSHPALKSLDEWLRQETSPLHLKAVRSYEVRSTDGQTLFARYENYTLAESQI